MQKELNTNLPVYPYRPMPFSSAVKMVDIIRVFSRHPSLARRAFSDNDGVHPSWKKHKLNNKSISTWNMIT
jgi:hypothetical protein